MIELRGKYGEAKVFTDVVDQESISQIIGLYESVIRHGPTVRCCLLPKERLCQMNGYGYKLIDCSVTFTSMDKPKKRY